MSRQDVQGQVTGKCINALILCGDIMKTHFPIGLTLQQSTDPKTLKKELEKLDRQLRELNIAHQTRYVPKDVKIKLKEQLASKVSL